jgi:hypothetical protein
MDFLTFGISIKINHMKLRLLLTTFCLLGIGIFSHAQDKKKTTKPIVEDGPDAIPITVTSTKKAHKKPPPPPPKAEVQYDKNGKQLPPPPPPPKVEVVKFAPPRIVKDGDKVPPPPPPKVDLTHYKAPQPKPEVQYDKNGKRLPPPPPPPSKPAKNKAEKPVAPDAPPAADQRG